MPHTPAPPHERKFSCDDFGARLDRFEDAWRSQTPPSIDDYLVPPDADGPEGFDLRELLRELIMIDIDWRWRPEYPSGDPILVPGPLPRKP